MCLFKTISFIVFSILGLDSTLRSFSTEVDNFNKSLGQASYNRKAAKKKGVKNDPGKMLPIVNFDAG